MKSDEGDFEGDLEREEEEEEEEEDEVLTPPDLFFDRDLRGDVEERELLLLLLFLLSVSCPSF